ncbi:MAG: hypothetical protein ABH805_01470, partial [Candidatus Nealsonbacteria bacterium]
MRVTATTTPAAIATAGIIGNSVFCGYGGNGGVGGSDDACGTGGADIVGTGGTVGSGGVGFEVSGGKFTTTGFSETGWPSTRLVTLAFTLIPMPTLSPIIA